jgi:hypothetical protein
LDSHYSLVPIVAMALNNFSHSLTPKNDWLSSMCLVPVRECGALAQQINKLKNVTDSQHGEWSQPCG